MSMGREAVRHAGGRYRRLLAPLRHPVESIEAEAHHLVEIEQAGEAGETPFIVLIGIVLFLLPIVLVILGLAFGAYYIIG
jgi:hypothetical protein